jgi:hypothetical protein
MSRAWHIQDPGSRVRTPGAWDNLTNGNTIAISAIARNDGDVSDAQRTVMQRLVAQLVRTHGIDVRNIVGHGDIQAGPRGNRERTEGTALALELREGRMPPSGDNLVRLVADRGGNQPPPGAPPGPNAPPPGPNAQPPPSLTETRVWERIVGSATEIENFARAERRRLELAEDREARRYRTDLATEGSRLLRNLEERRLRDANTPGIASLPDPERPELTQEWLDANRHALSEGVYNRLLRGLTEGGRARVSNPSVFSNLTRMARDPASHPDVVVDLANDAYRSHTLTARDRDLIIGNVRSRRERPDVETSPFVSEAFRELHRRVGIPRRGASADDLEKIGRDVLWEVLRDGKPVTIDDNVIAEVHRVLANSLGLMPPGHRFGVLVRAEPQTNGMMLLTLRGVDVPGLGRAFRPSAPWTPAVRRSLGSSSEVRR